ncbi:hypothetical protein KFE98_16130 [bacterium SCSIO 12741]|nr:hypothetical protein KFE98_16130 [bacterium SCSIO 12741]
MIVKPANGRAEIIENTNSLQITIPSRKNWFLIPFLGFWSMGWLMGEITVIGALFSSTTPFVAKAFMLVWLGAWTVGGMFALYGLSWMLTGREVIRLENGILTIEKRVTGYSRSRGYELGSVANMAINPSADLGVFNYYNKWNSFGLKGGKIKFSYGMQTVKFANDIDEAEARMILDKLKANSLLSPSHFEE